MKADQTNSGALSRRRFLKSSSVAVGALAFGVPTLLRAANLNSKLNLATVGVMGKGQSDTDHCSDENIVALCDVDADRSAPQRQKYPNARFYQDYRRLFDEMAASIDAVIVATPDHMHALVASRAMKEGKHVYCQKPLVQTIYEARYLRDLAQSRRLVTQMGNQGSSADGLRRAVECIQAGIIGPIHEVHVWTDRPVWPQGLARPAGADAIPTGLAWDLWLGAAPLRPYKSGVYEPFIWRGWQDFGTGALGDMACHTVNLPFRALNLAHPAEIIPSTLGPVNQETYPIGSKIVFQFPKHSSFFRRQLKFVWYDGGMPDPQAPHGHDYTNKPPRDLLAGIENLLGEVPNSGCLLIGDKGQIFSPDDYGEQFFVKRHDDAKFVHYKRYAALDSIPKSLPRNEFSGDSDHKHHLEWIAAIKENNPDRCFSRFAIAAQLTEIMLLGCVALRVGKTIKWDGPAMRALHCPEAAPFIKRENRPGWALA